MNPQDLLYTNTFVSTNIINKKELNNETKYYKKFQDHVDKNANITKKYLDRNIRDGEPINVNKNKSKPWPPTNEKNYKPIFSDAVSDVVENKYIKAIRTIISIYSKDRNKQKYLIPNEYIIKMGKEFINIYKIKLIDLNIPNTIPPVNHTNNIIRWLYPTNNLLNYTVTGNNLYPFLNSYEKLPPYFFYYSSLNADGSLPDKQSSILREPQDIYQAIIEQGFYNTKELKHEIENKLNNILHTVNEGIVSSYKNFPNQSGNYSKESRLIRNTCHNFNIDINPYSSICTIINRAEEIKIIAIQTLPQSTMQSPVYDSNLKDDINYNIDIFWNFFYFVVNPVVYNVFPNTDHVFTHRGIMNGRYLFNHDAIFNNYTEYLKSNINTDLCGAEISNMAPSFIITVKDIGVLFGGINPNDYFKLFDPLTKNDISNYQNNCYPIVFTDMPSIGGINKNLINHVEFFDLYFLVNNIDIIKSDTDYDRLKKVTSFYYHFDDIRIGTEKFKRYAFYIHTNSFLNRIGYFFKKAGFINCKTQENIIISESLYNVMGNNKNCGETIINSNIYDNNYQSCFCKTKSEGPETNITKASKGIINNSQNICFYGDWISSNNIKKINEIPSCGRSLPFAFRDNINLDDTNNIKNNNINNNGCVGKINSLLTILGWKQNNTRNISNYSPFKFIHRNTDTIETNINEYSQVIRSNNNDGCTNVEYNFSIIPQDILNLEQISGNIFVFRSIPFIFLRLSFPSLPIDTVSEQLIKTTSDKLETSNIYDEYYDNPSNNLNNLGQNYQTLPLLSENDILKIIAETKGENQNQFNELRQEIKREKRVSENCGFKTTDQLLKKETTVIFAKINMNAVPGNAYNKQNYDYEFIFYDKPLQSVNTMKIELLSPDGELLDFRQEHNMTLEIMEFRDVLKETLFDTRHGEVVTTGIKKV